MGHVVPETVQRAVQGVLDRHRKQPLDGVTGLSVAERLAAGEVNNRDIVSLHRFFLVHDRSYLRERQHARDASSSALCRSWDLRGAERGRAWVDRIYRALVNMSEVKADPYDDLMSSEPDEVYVMFGSGAYGWEFGLDTMDKAAKFVEDYHRATGHILDVQRAFGESGKAVANAMLRRTCRPDPMVLGIQLQDSYPVATRDTDALAEAMSARPIFEIMRSAGLPVVRMAKGITWPEWVAFCATCSEVRPPSGPLSGKCSPTHSPRSEALHEVEGVERTFFTFFHPDGPGYVDDAGTEHEGIHEELAEWLSSPDPDCDRDYLLDLTERLMHWCEITGRNASLSRTYVEAWRRRDWRVIADSIPLDSPHRADFLALEDRSDRDPLGPASAMDGPIAGQPSVPDEVGNVGWELGDVIRNGNRTFYAFAQDGSKIVLAPLYVWERPHQITDPIVVDPRDYAAYRPVMHNFLGVDHKDSPMVAWLAPEITVEPPLTKLDAIPPEWGNVGDRIQLDDSVVFLLGAVKNPSEETRGRAHQVVDAIVAVRRDSEWGRYWSIETISGSLLTRPVYRSYYPQNRPFERIPSGPQPETGLFRPVATPMAFDFAKKQGMSILKKPLPIRIGARFSLDDMRTRTVIGWAKKDGKDGYVMVSEKGTLTWKSAERAAKEFSRKPTTYVQSVIRNSIHHPDEIARYVYEWSTANYVLSDKMKRLAKEHRWSLTGAPPVPQGRFLVGVPIRISVGTTSLLGWIITPATENARSGVFAVLDAEGDGYVLMDPDKLSEDGEVVYESESGVDVDRGIVTLARQGGPISVMHETFSLPTSVDSFDVNPKVTITPILETSFPWIPRDVYVAAAIIGMIPAGTKVSTGGTVRVLETPGLVLLRPVGEADASLMIPRGVVVSPYDPVAIAAYRAVFRQTGLSMQPHTHVGDFASGMTITRVYTGTIIGGNPTDKRMIGEGTDAVLIVQLDERGRVREWARELIGRSGDRWQLDAIDEAVKMLEYNRLDTEHHVLVTGPQDTVSGKPIPAVDADSQWWMHPENRPGFAHLHLTVSGEVGSI